MDKIQDSLDKSQALKDLDLQKNIANFRTPEMLIMAAAGLALLIFGYRIKKIAFFIIWFILGFNLTTILLPTIANISPEIVSSELWQALLPVGGGLLLALLGFSIEKLCVAGICFALVMIITAQYFGTDIQTLAIGGIVGVIAGGAATMLMKPAIIIATSVAGAYSLTLAILTLIPGIDKNMFYFPILIGLSLVGSIIQFITTKRA